MGEQEFSYPVFLRLSGRHCLVVGGGPVAFRKMQDLLESGAVVTVVAETPIAAFDPFAADGTITLRVRRFEPDDVEGAVLIFAATDDDEVNERVAGIARSRGALVNVADSPGLCDFYSGAAVKRGPLRIAVSTSGNAPGLAARIREELEKQFGEEWSEYLVYIGSLRRQIISSELIREEQKREALRWLGSSETFELFRDKGKEKVWDNLQRIISSS